MDLHERQQFDFLLHTAAERFVERIEQHNGGAAPALSRLRAGSNGSGIWLNQFVDAIFEDFLIANADGACFVLRALAARTAPAAALGSGTVEQMLVHCARLAFTEALAARAMQLLEQHTAFEDTGAAADGTLWR